MSQAIEEKLSKIPVVNLLVKLLGKVKLPGLEGLSLYDLVELYVIGIAKGALTARASAIAYSFFMALFPFILFLLNLIPYLPIEPYHFVEFIDDVLPKDTASFFMPVILDIIDNPRGGLLSFVFLLTIFLKYDTETRTILTRI